MLPREFYNRYGPVRSQAFTVANGASYVVPLNQDRYLLMVINSSTQTFQMIPRTDNLGAGLGISIPTLTAQIFTMELHGTLPMAQWGVTNTGAAPGIITVVEGFAFVPPGLVVERGTDEAVQKLLRERGGNNNGRAVPQPVPANAGVVTARRGPGLLRVR